MRWASPARSRTASSFSATAGSSRRERRRRSSRARDTSALGPFWPRCSDMPGLEIEVFPTHRIEEGRGPATWGDGVLRIDVAALGEHLARDPRLPRVDVAVAHPGESVRIVHVLDAVEPRIKIAGAR